MSDEQQRFPAWPLITAVISDSQRAGSYTARVEYPNAPMRILKRGDLQTLRREIITQVQKWTNDEWRKPVRLQVEDPHGSWLLGIPKDGAAVELDAIATTPEPPTVPDRPPPRRPAPVRAAVTPRRSRIRARRLVSLTGVILAAAAVAIVVTETLPGQSSPADHHRLAVTHTTTTPAVTPTPTTRIPAVIVKPTPKPAQRRVARHHRPRAARAHRAVATHRAASTPPQSATPSTPTVSAPASSAPASTQTVSAPTVSAPASTYTPPASSRSSSPSLPPPAGGGAPPL